MSKVMYIQDCYFKLPEDFDGTCGNALMHRLEQEKKTAISNEAKNENRIDDFWNSDKKCTMAYCISTDDAFKSKDNNN